MNMKKLLLLSLIFFCSLVYGQRKDTLFLKSGQVLTVFKIAYIEGNQIHFILKEGQETQLVDTSLVQKYCMDVDSKINYSKSIESDYYQLNKNRSEQDYKTGWIQYNLQNYYGEERTSQIFYGAGLLAGAVYLCLPDEKNNNSPILYVSGTLTLIGYLIHLDSFKWLKRASIEPIRNGVSVKLKL